MIHKDEIQVLLEKYMDRTLYSKEWGVYFIKELVTKIRNMKIEIYSNDHNPPHFHVKSKNGTINAKFRLDNCELIGGKIGKKDIKRIEAFYSDDFYQEFMKEMWNKSKQEKISQVFKQ
jgi:hypothetical protein